MRQTLALPGDHFEEVFLSNRLRLACPVYPAQMNQRLVAQQALFVAGGDLRASFEDNLRAPGDIALREHLEKIILRARPGGPPLRDAVLLDCNLMNITHATLFPGLDGFAHSLAVNMTLNRAAYESHARHQAWTRKQIARR
jgi:hypothetical protein